MKTGSQEDISTTESGYSGTAPAVDVVALWMILHEPRHGEVIIDSIVELF